MTTTFRYTSAGLVMLASLALGACGETKSDRALSGAGLGAAAGAATTILTGGSLGTGAVVGGALGAAAGAATDKDQINLGKPAWQK
jgi:hypothetical protein